MLKVNNYQPGAELYEKENLKILKLLPENLPVFKDVDVNFTAKMTPGFIYDFLLTSDPLPLKLFGGWAYAVQEMRLLILGNIMKETGEVVYRFEYSIEYIGGGGTTTHIAALGTTNFSIKYNQQDGKVLIDSSNQRLSNAIRTFDIFLSSEDIISDVIGQIKDYLRKDELSKDTMQMLLFPLNLLSLMTNEFLNRETIERSDYTDLDEALSEIDAVIKEFKDIVAN